MACTVITPRVAQDRHDIPYKTNGFCLHTLDMHRQFRAYALDADRYFRCANCHREDIPIFMHLHTRCSRVLAQPTVLHLPIYHLLSYLTRARVYHPGHAPMSTTPDEPSTPLKRRLQATSCSVAASALIALSIGFHPVRWNAKQTRHAIKSTVTKLNLGFIKNSAWERRPP